MEGIDFYVISTWILPVIFAITVHEVAHGWAALKLGDDTALQQGRLTLNPIAHIHPVGTILMPGLLILSGLPAFGFAKPVPVYFNRLNNPKRDMVLVAAAGPGVNIAMAAGAVFLLNFFTNVDFPVSVWVGDNLSNAIVINLVLAVFNMIPIPPLDGGRVAVGLLPMPYAQYWARLERYGFPIIFGLLFLPFLLSDLFGVQIDLLGAIIFPVVELLIKILFTVLFWVG